MVNQALSTPQLILRISVTDRCNLRCLYCVPDFWAKPQHDGRPRLAFDEIARIVQAAARVASPVAVRITGGEPLLRHDIERLVEMLSAAEVCDIALTTNGQLLAAKAQPLRKAGLKRVNVSLDTLRPLQFSRLTGRGDLEKTVAGIQAALDAGLAPVKLNTVALRGVNDGEFCDLARFALNRHCQIRFIELMPMGPAAARHREWFIPGTEIRQRLARDFEFGPPTRRPGASAEVFPVRCRTTGQPGEIGFISPVTDPFCDACRRLRLTSRGELLGCLMQDTGQDLRAILRSGGDLPKLQQAVRAALALKSGGRSACNPGLMACIGG